MTTDRVPDSLVQARVAFDELVEDIRPQLHRYCARMTGSVVDGEDIVQDALAKAYYALPTVGELVNLKAWLFRIAHNKAIDHLRRYDHRYAEPLDDHSPFSAEDPPLEDKELATVALSLFVELTPLQRSCVFLKDVLGYSLAELSELHDASVGAIKAALHRGRTRLRELSANVEETPRPALEDADAALLARYIDRFNARDFDGIRELLADDVRLDLIGKAQRRGARVANYVHRYSEVDDWRFTGGFVEGRPAVLVYDPREPSAKPDYFVLIEHSGDRVTLIRDYRYARHVMRDAEVVAA